jgi:hypothetical protein
MCAGIFMWPTATVFGISIDFSDIVNNSAKFHLHVQVDWDFSGNRSLHVIIEKAIDLFHIAKRYRAGK